MGEFNVKIKNNIWGWVYIFSFLKIGVEEARKLENDIRRTADFCSLVILEFMFKDCPQIWVA